MQDWPALSKPPVQEAILEFKFHLPNSIQDENLESFCQAVNSKLPQKKLRFAINVSGEFKPNVGKEPQIPEVKSSRIHDGYMLSSDNGKTVLQIASQLFSYHIIEPYRNWPALFTEAQEIWAVFMKHIPDIKVVNISLRYLNRIEISENELIEGDGFGNYFNLLPNIPDGLPRSVNSFFMQLNIPDATNELISIINLTSEPPANNKNKIILDISVLKQVQYSNADSEIWNDVNKLRDFKNQIFFNSITETTKNLYL